MQIEVLSENTAKDGFLCEHGLSLLIKTKGKNILFDMGASDNFIKNAQKLGEDLSKVDMAFISHGHADHGGGLSYFLHVNKKANVYLKSGAFEPHYSKRAENNVVNIGLDKALYCDRIKILTSDCVISQDVESMCNIQHKYPLPITNCCLYKDGKTDKVFDDFTHEHNLVINENGYILFVGCAHNGIKNILEHFYNKYGTYPKAVIGGFHLSSRTTIAESHEYISELASYLLSTKAMFYTCHCTGEKAYLQIKQIMGDRVDYASSGCKIEI